ncbi:hypothetical protein [Spiroplasma cantharicola]|uniref:Uncharacterized protein n=1 Tax=Spiroplasma cantharicola TaxID=362837 RepID=A0A0M4JSH3_9MOLU|nr:hypothetical protein [Spiroplasma cantharicola]ALD66510.1 hypothetical protein SCANT_v1c06040 [Spiroplasma cantharicola]
MSTFTLIIIFTLLSSINWIVSIFTYRKYEGKLKGKNLVIGVIGLILFIGVSWIIATFLPLIILIIFISFYLAWWLNYMYYLLKQNKIKERIF